MKDWVDETGQASGRGTGEDGDDFWFHIALGAAIAIAIFFAYLLGASGGSCV